MSDSGFEAFTILLSMIVCFMIMTKQCTYNVLALLIFSPMGKGRESEGTSSFLRGTEGTMRFLCVFLLLLSSALDQVRFGSIFAFCVFYCCLAGTGYFVVCVSCCVGKSGLDV
ncbi:hypothetical protein CABS01_00355 [Colletotrichum abscissum]|uniref:Uncharacterized protein n=1 Tax=Colletotrichum abscissum TaxID=1671311 RepID=A0A9Q0AYN1_9PEZI|nr:uncharacterized protein CABS01_00355 [Colletotrichum abscissum]KAI3531920.1 hypothetical protein CABS02_14026 [Colletotrichum abscissum]KAK1525266.1 hypothetical protein CABS01_00355 [Colletotrichum abscissum]